MRFFHRRNGSVARCRRRILVAQETSAFEGQTCGLGRVLENGFHTWLLGSDSVFRRTSGSRCGAAGTRGRAVLPPVSRGVHIAPWRAVTSSVCRAVRSDRTVCGASVGLFCSAFWPSGRRSICRPVVTCHLGLAPPQAMLTPDAPRTGGDVGHNFWYERRPSFSGASPARHRGVTGVSPGPSPDPSPGHHRGSQSRHRPRHRYHEHLVTGAKKLQVRDKTGAATGPVTGNRQNYGCEFTPSPDPVPDPVPGPSPGR